jgi:lambda family phage portal protein
MPEFGWATVPAYGTKSGRRNILHLFEKERPGQRRGIPYLAPVIEALKQVSRLSEAELMASIITSFFTVFVKSASGNALQDSFTEEEKVTSPAEVTKDKNLYEMGHGNIMEMQDGDEVQIADPKRPNAAFDPFFTAIVKQISAALEQPYEVVMLCFLSSYSASRAALLQAWKFFLTRRIWLKRELCNPVYQEWLLEAVLKGRIDAPGFFLDPLIRAAWSGAEWDGPGMGQLDPVRETEASVARINGKLSTYTKETAAIDGDNWDTMVDRLSREKRIIKEAGLDTPPPGAPAPVAPAPGQPPENPPNQDDQQPDNQQPGNQQPDNQPTDEGVANE